MTSSPVSRLEIDAVRVAYRGRPVLHGVSAAVAAGGWLAVIGPNGAGKSTLLKAVAGAVAYQGAVRRDGTELGTLSPRARGRAVAYAPQNPLLPEGITVTDYALLGRTPHLRLLGREGRRDLDVVARVLDRLDLTALAGRGLATLSGGERQRAVLARALAQQSGVLVLDEPTTGLDVGHAQALLELVDRLRVEDGVTVLSSLHDLTLAGQYADDLLLLDGGHVAASGPPRDVLTPALLSGRYHAALTVLDLNGTPAVLPQRGTARRAWGVGSG